MELVTVECGCEGVLRQLGIAENRSGRLEFAFFKLLERGVFFPLRDLIH